MMDDDWDDGSVAPVITNASVASEGGTKFSSGRGFSLRFAGVDDWGTATTDFNDIPLSDHFNNNRSSYGNKTQRSRGGRGGRGGNNWNSNSNKDNGWSESYYYNDSNKNEIMEGQNRDINTQDFERNQCVGRGKSRGRSLRGSLKKGDDNFESRHDKHTDEKLSNDKSKEIYIPFERMKDEELFTNTITSGINFLKLDEIDVKISGEDVPPPITSFETSGLRPHLLENVEKSGYIKPTPIQKHAIPIIMNGRDLMGCAQTGSGKTAAFLLPIINKLIASNKPPFIDESGCQPKVIIVSPTRELAIQIYEQAKKFAYNSTVKTVVAYGGTSVTYQKNVILNGCHILVATPGRLNDFVKRKHISFASVSFFVLDEADRMLDMGFLPTIEQMMGDSTMVITGDRQTLMFSATFPEEIQHLAGKFLHNYIFVAVGIVGSASTDVQQLLYQVTKFKKRDKLLNLLREENCRTVVFVETKRNADFLATYLCENDIKATSIHGDRLQREREQALWDFKKNICSTLVATGVAARGLDIEGIQHVINYDLPNSIDEYVHRIGRTGRVGNRGKATSFFDPSCDTAMAGGLAKILKQAGQEIPDWLTSGNFSSHYSGYLFGGRDIRGDDFGRAQNFNIQPAEENDEEW